VPIVKGVAVPEGDGLGYAAIAMDAAAIGVVAVAFVPDLFQEVATIMLIVALGLVMFLFAVILAIVGIKTKREAGQSPGLAPVALALGVLPLVLGFWFLGSSVVCSLGGDCGGTG
jgi:hypothetical protein